MRLVPHYLNVIPSEADYDTRYPRCAKRNRRIFLKTAVV
jgi:hypothetical protein